MVKMMTVILFKLGGVCMSLDDKYIQLSSLCYWNWIQHHTMCVGETFMYVRIYYTDWTLWCIAKHLIGVFHLLSFTCSEASPLPDRVSREELLKREEGSAKESVSRWAGVAISFWVSTSGTTPHFNLQTLLPDIPAHNHRELYSKYETWGKMAWQ